MIAPFTWLWKQFNGPQIVAVCKAIESYMRSTWETQLNYWQHLSIDTANNKHLTLIGALQGIARPLMEIEDESFFWFSAVPEEGTYYPSVPYRQSEHGLSDVDEMSRGGKFSDMTPIVARSKNQLSEPLYRCILQSARESEAGQGSLAYIDDVLYGLYKYLNPASDEPEYKIEMLTKEQIEFMQSRSVGDIRVNLGGETQWGEYLNQIAAEVNMLGETLYFPVPTMFAESYL